MYIEEGEGQDKTEQSLAEVKDDYLLHLLNLSSRLYCRAVCVKLCCLSTAQCYVYYAMLC